MFKRRRRAYYQTCSFHFYPFKISSLRKGIIQSTKNGIKSDISGTTTQFLVINFDQNDAAVTNSSQYQFTKPPPDLLLKINKLKFKI